MYIIISILNCILSMQKHPSHVYSMQYSKTFFFKNAFLIPNNIFLKDHGTVNNTQTYGS